MWARFGTLLLSGLPASPMGNPSLYSRAVEECRRFILKLLRNSEMWAHQFPTEWSELRMLSLCLLTQVCSNKIHLLRYINLRFFFFWKMCTSKSRFKCEYFNLSTFLVKKQYLLLLLHYAG